MEIKLHRKEVVGQATLGELWIEGTSFKCYTLEDVERIEKVMNQTAIPTGRYKLRLSLSTRFKRITLEVLDVPNFEGIRIHAGNTENHTSGCPLVAWSRDKGRIIRSNACEIAITALATQMQNDGEEIWLTVTSDLKPLPKPEPKTEPKPTV